MTISTRCMIPSSASTSLTRQPEPKRTTNKACDRATDGQLFRKYRRAYGITLPLGNHKPHVYYW